MKFFRFIIVILVTGACGLAFAQDKEPTEDVIRTETQLLKGTIKQSRRNGVVIRLSGSGNEMTIPHSSIVAMRVREPSVVEAGVKAYEAGRMKEAARYLQKAVMNYQALDVDWASKALVMFGRASVASGDYENGEKAFKAFMAWYPDNERILDARIGMAEIDVAQTNYTAALDKFNAIVEPFKSQLKPSSEEMPYASEAFLGIARCMDSLGKKKEALETYLTVLALYPDDKTCPEALFRSGELFMEKGNFDRAEGNFEEVTKEYSNSPFASKARRAKDDVRVKRMEQEKEEKSAEGAG